MKALKIITLLIAGLLCNHLQSMEEQTYPLETKLFDGTISVKAYFETLEKTFPAYGGILKDLKDTHYHQGENNLYNVLINTTAERLQEMQAGIEALTEAQIAAEELWKGQVTKADIKRAMPREIQSLIFHAIDMLYTDLKELIRSGRAQSENFDRN